MSFFWLIGSLVFVLGTAVGSFLNVLVYRMQRGTDWVAGRSRCERCRKKIPWYENIPLLSYVVLRGKCSKCGKPIDTIHPLMELLTGVLFLWWYAAGYLFFRLTTAPLHYVQPLFWLCVGVILVAVVISDIRYMRIPRWAVIALTGLTLLYRGGLLAMGAMQWQDFVWSLVWSVLLTAGFFALWWGTRGRGFGFGDVQLAFPLGLILGGWQRIVISVFVAFISGALVGVALVAGKKKRLKQAVPFGPFLIFGTTIGLVWGFALWEWYVKILTG